jgi:hypothetical protein
LQLAAYLFILVDSLALAAVLLLPNPYVTSEVPLALPLRYAGFMYFFLLLMQAAFSFRPWLLLWTGLCGIGAGTVGSVNRDPARDRHRSARRGQPRHPAHHLFRSELRLDPHGDPRD